MDELTIVIDSWGHKELKDYLMSLNGILDVKIQKEEQLDVYLKYNSDLISPKIIKMEILLFLNLTKTPCMLAFDKYPKFKTSHYIITKDSFCCEYCFKGAIEELFEMDGIEKVQSNFDEDYLLNKSEEKITIKIEYNPELINKEQMKQIELNLHI